MARKTADATMMNIQPLEKRTLRVPIVGTSPLIVHRWSKKAKEQMLDKQLGKAAPKKPPKDVQQDYLDSLYFYDEKRKTYGFPAPGFKAAIVGAARYFEGITMVNLRRSLFLIGHGEDQLVQIHGNPEPREDMVRVGMGTADLRYRGMFKEWRADLLVKYVPSMLTEEAVFALVDAAGIGGVGEWRPSKADTGMYGTFEVAS